MNDDAKAKQGLKVLRQKLDDQLPPVLRERAIKEIERLGMAGSGEWYWREIDRLGRWVDWITKLPWEKSSEDKLDLKYAEEALNKSHYGLQKVKNRILEYLAVLILQEKRDHELQQAPILCLVGLVGTGKTTIAKSMAIALGREFIRIPFGGLGDPLYLRGQSRVHLESDPGQIIKGLCRAETNNPVILLDEIDRVADDALNTIMGVLVELLDPEQNDKFTDYFIDYPFDLSKAIFVATANHTRRIATAVRDRLEVLQMPSYTNEEKQIIAQKFLYPKAVTETGLRPGELIIGEDCWPKIIRPLGYDGGVRTLKRTVLGICRKVARLMVEGKTNKVKITPENIKSFLPSW